MTSDEFRLRHSGEIRDALAMIDGDSGAFELLKHGAVLRGAEKIPYAVVRATDSERIHVLIRDGAASAPRWRKWHDIESRVYRRLATEVATPDKSHLH
jgi:hypothetical protein